MGRSGMGPARGPSTPGNEGSDFGGGRADDAGSPSPDPRRLDRGPDGRLLPKYLPFRAGQRFGELTVVENQRASRALCQCSCGAPPHHVATSNIRSGKSTRCNKCAKHAANKNLKHYWGYADICPDNAHRRRLLNRIAACLTRCRPGGDKNYGGRGIRVYPDWNTGTAGKWRSGTEGRRKYLTHLLTLEGWDQPHLDIDRINVDGNYEPGNLRFTTRKDNMLNRRSVPAMQDEIARLRSDLRRAEEEIYSYYGCRPDPGA